jgi:hypothetical protein
MATLEQEAYKQTLLTWGKAFYVKHLQALLETAARGRVFGD